jgi:type VI secretion system protein ImpA
MANPTVLDFEAILAPVSAEQPSGSELKSDPVNNAIYYGVKDARDSARSAERLMITAESDSGQDPPDWVGVKSKCINAITNYSKDVWFAAWLIEAMCRLNGFAGLRDGFRLVREMCDKYWDGIHPAPDDDGYATPMAQLRGLNGDDAEGALVRPIDAIPLTRSPTHGALSMVDFKQAADLQQITDPTRRQARIDAGAVTLENFEKAVRESPAEFLRNLYEDIEQALEEFRLMTAFLDERCGEDEYGEPAAPPSSNIRQQLEAVRDRVKSVARQVLEAAAPAEAAATEEGGEMIAAEGEANGAIGPARGRLVTRDDALNALLQVADYFRKTEPHSPVSYSLEQAVRWGRMSLPELLAELIPDEAARDQMSMRAGIPKPGEGLQ